MAETSKTIQEVALASPLRRKFDYIIPENFPKIEPGSRVEVPFGTRTRIGIALCQKNHTDIPNDKLKEINKVLDAEPVFNSELLSLIQWASDYYQYPIGEVCDAALPTFLRQGKSAEIEIKSHENKIIKKTNPLDLNPEQSLAFEKIASNLGQFKPFCLDGITGSGKTEVYFHLIQQVIDSGKQALVLIPEISLTPQTLARFTNRFGNFCFVSHSGLTNKKRLETWVAARTGQAKIIIGTRSAIFIPLLNPGIIIIDEEHDVSFKQQDKFRYSARDLSIIRAKNLTIPVVLGSATPSLETLYNCQKNKYGHLKLTQRAGNAIPPKFTLLDIKDGELNNGLSSQLVQQIKNHLENNNQVLIFLNRRGFAPVLICHHCGWTAECKRCDANMTFHLNPRHLHCHHCNSKSIIPKNCPACNNFKLDTLGLGTENLEKNLEDLFSQYGIARIDRDSVSRKNQLEEIINNIHTKKTNLLIGTQMIAKGHHFPDVTLVAILDVDSRLFSSDFRAPERLGQLILQVAGRSGRAEKPGEVIIQTRHPEHPVLLDLVQKGYNQFANNLLSDRKITTLPPYTHAALIHAEALKEKLTIEFLNKAKIEAERLGLDNIKLLGPIPACMPKRAGHYRAQLLLLSPDRKNLQKLLTPLALYLENSPLSRKTRWALDVDPQEMF